MLGGSPSNVRLAALGDLMLAGQWTTRHQTGDLRGALDDLAALRRDVDLLFGNLEVTLRGDEGEILKQPRLVGSPEAVDEALQVLSPDILNLSNNHAFDCYASGFRRVQELLHARGIGSLGAGLDLKEAAKPLIVERKGIRVGWLAFADDETRPSHRAGEGSFGVNVFDLESALVDIQSLKPAVHHVLVSIHWGVEYSNLPSPSQVIQARAMIDAGATAILGHHAHVTQGIERHHGGLIVYNLGNAAATDLEIEGRLAIRQTRRSLSSFAILLELSQDRLVGWSSRPFRFRGGKVELQDRIAAIYLDRANRALGRGITGIRWRRRRFFEDVVLRAARKLHPRVVRSVRRSHFIKVFRNLVRALRGQGPA